MLAVSVTSVSSPSFCRNDNEVALSANTDCSIGVIDHKDSSTDCAISINWACRCGAQSSEASHFPQKGSRWPTASAPSLRPPPCEQRLGGKRSPPTSATFRLPRCTFHILRELRSSTSIAHSRTSQAEYPVAKRTRHQSGRHRTPRQLASFDVTTSNMPHCFHNVRIRIEPLHNASHDRLLIWPFPQFCAGLCSKPAAQWLLGKRQRVSPLVEQLRIRPPSHRRWLLRRGAQSAATSPPCELDRTRRLRLPLQR